MGNNTVGSTKISYTTKDKVSVEYIYYDLKGKNRFPPEPANEREVELMFEKCLKEIEATPDQLQIIRDFNAKYKFRFVILHGRKVEESKERNELTRLRRTQNFDQGQFRGIQEKRKQELDEKLLLLEGNQTAIRMHLGAIDRFISEKNAWSEFIKINGIERLVHILNKAIKANKQGTKTIFQNQIQILKFLKSLSDHNQKEYFHVVATIPDYPLILLRAYHPVNVAVTAYVLMMLQDYSWKVQSGSILQTLQQFQAEAATKSFLDPFVETIYETNNILMCYYNLRFINELLISIVDDDEKATFENELHQQRYQLLIEDVKTKLQQNHFKVEHCTFQAVSQQIYKYATRVKQDNKQAVQQALMSRVTTNLDALQQHLLVNFVQGFITSDNSVEEEVRSDDDNDDDYITVLLIDGDKKSFNKFVLDTFNQIQHYYKYTIIIDEYEEGVDYNSIPEVEKFKKYGLSCEQYVKRIKGSCLKNGCEQQMLNCLKTMQYFEKSEWRRLQGFLQDQMKSERSAADAQSYRQQLEEKQKELKAIKKDFYQLKTEMVNMSKIEQPKIVNVSKLDMSAFDLDKADEGKGNSGNVLPEPKKLEIPASLLNPSTLPPILPPPPPPPAGNSMNIMPTLGLPTVSAPTISFGGVILPPPPPPPPMMGGLALPPPISSPFGLEVLPPPPPTPSNNSNILPPLPPPPSFNNTILPPPPSGIPILPPPPSGIPNLPPPPSGLPILPPPPSGLPILPPPPSGIPILPPPPSGLPNLPPPPSGLPNLPPPPLGLPNLPPPPSFGGASLPPPPSIPGLGNLPPPPPPIGGGLGLPSLPSIPGGFIPMPQQKVKEKRKPKVPLKACNYKTLSYTEIQKTIWSEIDDAKVKIDESQLQSLFSRGGGKDMNKVQSAIILSNPEPKKKEAIKLLSSDRWRNMQIVLTKLKIPEGAITEALTTCSGKYAVSNVLESVKSLIPTEEEQANISSYEGDLEDLGKPERFIKELITIPEYANRIKAILFNGLREELYFDLQKKIEDLTTAFQSLKSNYRLHHVLEVALAVGNYLNGTGLKGGAWGFKLDTLERMQEVKSQDNKMNAGLYIIKEVWKKYQYPIFNKEEVDMYQFISKMPISQIKVDLAQLKKYAISIEKAFNSKKKNNPNDRIDEHCEQILIEAKSRYEQLNAAATKMEQAYTDCANFYCEDPAKGASDQIGKKLFKSILFIFNTEKIYYELEERRKKEEARKAVKNQVKFNAEADMMKKKEPATINPESAPKLNLPQQSAIKLPMPPITPIKSGITEITAEERLKELEKTQQERERKFLEEMMKKRNSKMVAFRQSKAPGAGINVLKRGDPEIDFLKGL